MATVQKRTWLSRGPTGHKVRKVAWGYTLQVDGKQERKYSADWTEEDARTELAKRILAKAPTALRPTTLGQAVERYLQAEALAGGGSADAQAPGGAVWCRHAPADAHERHDQSVSRRALEPALRPAREPHGPLVAVHRQPGARASEPSAPAGP